MSELADELFPPRPGGRVDSARKAAAAQPAAADTVENDNGPVTYAAVRVRPEPPDLGTARTITLSAVNKVTRLIGQDAQRRSCIVLAIDNDVYIASDEGLAQDAAGGTAAEGVFYLPAGIALPVDTQAKLWVACTTTATSSRVSVLITKDSAP